MIDVVRDCEGVRMAIEEILEEDFARSRVDHEIEGADERTRERMESRIPPRTLSPGYYAFASHLLRLEQMQQNGIQFDALRMPAYECDGLLAVERARSAFGSRHPKCGGCGAHLENRWTVKCHACGADLKPRG